MTEAAAPAPAYTLAETWLLNNRVNLLLLDSLSDAQLAYASTPRTRTVADQFAHLHNARVWWLERRARALAAKLALIEKGAADKPLLREALVRSGQSLADLFQEAERTGSVKGVKRGPIVFLGYTLAHEAHHRGQIILHLKYAKMPVDRMFGFSLWDWQKT